MKQSQIDRFWSLVRVNEIKKRKCMKCGCTFKSVNRICYECEVKNARYGKSCVSAVHA